KGRRKMKGARSTIRPLPSPSQDAQDAQRSHFTFSLLSLLLPANRATDLPCTTSTTSLPIQILPSGPFNLSPFPSASPSIPLSPSALLAISSPSTPRHQHPNQAWSPANFIRSETSPRPRVQQITAAHGDWANGTLDLGGGSTNWQQCLVHDFDLQ